MPCNLSVGKAGFAAAASVGVLGPSDLATAPGLAAAALSALVGADVSVFATASVWAAVSALAAGGTAGLAEGSGLGAVGVSAFASVVAAGAGGAAAGLVAAASGAGFAAVPGFGSGALAASAWAVSFFSFSLAAPEDGVLPAGVLAGADGGGALARAAALVMRLPGGAFVSEALLPVLEPCQSLKSPKATPAHPMIQTTTINNREREPGTRLGCSAGWSGAPSGSWGGFVFIVLLARFKASLIRLIGNS